MENLKEFCARWSDGTVNIDATVEKFKETLTNWVEDRERKLTNIAIAVSDIFDRYKGQTLDHAHAENLRHRGAFRLSRTRFRV